MIQPAETEQEYWDRESAALIREATYMSELLKGVRTRVLGVESMRALLVTQQVGGGRNLEEASARLVAVQRLIDECRNSLVTMEFTLVSLRDHVNAVPRKGDGAWVLRKGRADG